MSKRFMLVLVGVLAVVLTLGAFYYFVQNRYLGEPESITIANAQSFECDTLVYIAQQQRFFAINGLKVNILNYTSGMAAVNDLIAGKVDIAATAEFPLVRKALIGENISALACIGEFQLQEMIGRKDSGIENIKDLSGKRIGVPLGTVSEFYLGRFLTLHELSLEDVTIININPSEALKAITNGTIDAVIIWQPYAYAIKESIGSQVVSWSPQSSQATYIAEVATNDWISLHPDTVRRFLKALAEAEEYSIRNPSETKAFIQAGLNYADLYMEEIWDSQEFSIFLNQGFVTAMEDEARWMIDNNLTDAKEVPNFLNYIYFNGLSVVKAESVNIIH